MTESKKGGLLTVFFVVLIDLIGFGIVLPHLAFYASDLHASSFMVGFLYSIYSIAQLIFSPFWGNLSDRVGRRPVMIISTLGAAASYILFAFSTTLPLLFLSRFLAGMMAGNVSTAQAYVADVTTPENRAKGMGAIGAAFGIGFVIGPALGVAILQSSFFARLIPGNPYAGLGFFAACLSLSSFFLVLFKLPETVDKTHHIKEDAARVVKVSVFNPAFWKSLMAGQFVTAVFPLLLMSAFLLAFGQSSLYGAFPLFCKDRFLMTPRQVGMEYVWMGVVAVLIQGGLIKQLVKRFGERPLFFTGTVLFVLGLALLPFMPSIAAMTSMLLLMSLGASLAGPTLISLLSQQCDPKKYGTTLGASQGLSALGRAIGPAWGGALFGVGFQLPFWLTAVILLGTVWTGIKLSAKNQ